MLVADSQLSFDDIIDTTRPARPFRKAEPEVTRHPFESITASGPVKGSTETAAGENPFRGAPAVFPPTRAATRMSGAEAAVQGRRGMGPHFTDTALGEPVNDRQAVAPTSAAMWPATTSQPESTTEDSPINPVPLGAHVKAQPLELHDQPISAPTGAVSAEAVAAEPDLPQTSFGPTRKGEMVPSTAYAEPRPATVTALPTQPMPVGYESDISASVTPLPTRDYVQSHSHISNPVPKVVTEPEEEFYDATVARPPGVVRADTPIDGKFAVRAFRALPTLWQHVLWMTSVEERTTAETAERLQLSRGVTAAAVLHAREGLRHEWLSALLNERDLAISCSSVIQYMHAYACDVATSAETELIEQHLHRCVRCTTVTDEFARFPERLPYVLAPLAAAGVDVFSAGPESVETAIDHKESGARRLGGRHRA